MKRVKQNQKTATILWLMMWAATMPFMSKAQTSLTVQVPSNCEVVVAGTGGTTGAGGTVGNGGVVLMPDPTPTPISATFTLQNYIGYYTIGDWSLSGDLSENSPGLLPSGSADQSIASGSTSADIISYNKNLRQPSENGSPLLSTLARSKGRVSIGYSDTVHGCSGLSLSFDVYKTYSYVAGDTGSHYVPPIVGPDCWIAGETYTYSVDQIASDNLIDGIGLDQYYWQVADSGNNQITNFYTSADVSSITIVAPDTLKVPYTITTCFGRGNPWDGNNIPFSSHTTCRTRTIGGQPVMPQIAFYPSGCLSVSDTGFKAVVTPYDPSYTYTWAASVGSWGLHANTTGDTVVVTTGTNKDPGSLILTVTGCSAVDTVLHIERSFDSTVSITSNASCYSAGNTVTFTVSPSSVQNNFTNWIFPEGWTVLNYQNTTAHSTVQVQIPDTASASTYVIKAHACDSLSIVTDTINIRPKTPVFVSGDTCRPYGDSSSFSITVSPAGNYLWTQPWGSNINGTATQAFTPNGTSGGIITVRGIGVNGCNSTDSLAIPVHLGAIKPNSFSYTCLNFGGDNNTNTIHIANAPNPFYGTYAVTDPTGTFLSGVSVDASTGAITITISPTAPSNTYTLNVTHITTCDSSETAQLQLNYTNNGISINYNNFFGSDYYNTAPISLAADWFVNGVYHSTGNTLLLSSGPPATTISANVALPNGCTLHLETPGHNYSQMIYNGDGVTGIDESLLSNVTLIKVYPNPNNGNFTVEIPAFESEAAVRIYDIRGKIIADNKLNVGKNALKEHLTAGAYILMFTIDGKNSAQKMVVE